MTRGGHGRMLADAALPEILYIMGTGRSGTTVLEVMLKDLPGVDGVGEITHLFRDGFDANKPCSCGQPARGCELWAGIIAHPRWQAGNGAQGTTRLFRRIEAHGRFAKTLVGAISGADREAYREANRALFQGAGQMTGARVLVDSSKYPARALQLWRSFPGRVRILAVSRGPAGLIKAFSKPHRDEQKPKPLSAAVVYYLYVIACMALVRWKVGNDCMTVRYESLRRDPEQVLLAVADWLGTDGRKTVAKLTDGGEFDVGHILTGNRLRHRRRIVFERSGGSHRQPSWLRLLDGYRRVMGF